MKRTQLYLDDNLWEALEIKSKVTGDSVSELVRQAVREKYTKDPQALLAALEQVQGIWADRDDMRDTDAYVRSLRRSNRTREHWGE
ncbi:MAG: ribbon-helix-helix domain-containing protein [Acidobacteria bacterium]|nr:ribbon-helix-helix domain-containing protein [Acidobacteriota bacterium]